MNNSTLLKAVGIGWLLAALPLQAQNGEFWDGRSDAKFIVTITGKFSNQAPWNVNLLNAPVGVQRPPDLRIDPAIIKKLNASVKNLLGKILEGRGMNVSWRQSDYQRWKKQAIQIFQPDSDKYFHIELRIDGDNGLGGNYGGLDMRMYFRSLHRQWDVVFGYAFRTLEETQSPDDAVAHLEGQLRALLNDAIRDWKASLRKDLRYPVRYLFVSFDTKELSRKQRTFIEETLFPCLYQQTDSLGYVRLGRDDYQVFYRLGRRVETETEEDYLRWYSDILLFSMGTSDKYPCSLLRSPLADYRPEISNNPEEKKLTIHWTKPK